MNKYDKLSKERKELQMLGLVPDWFTTAGYQMFKEKYEHDTKGRSVLGQYERIARTASEHLKGTKYEDKAYDKFLDLLWNGWVSASSPVLGNTGTNKGLPVSCGGSDIQDSIDGFYNNLLETAVLTKHGFGTSSNLSNIRPRGSKVSIGGKANGVIPVIKEHVQSMRNVSQGQSRRGAWAGYLDIDHGDFWELTDFLRTEPDDLNVAWTVKDSFIAKLESDDAEAIKRFKRALFVKMLTGKGYFFFVDKANRKAPQVYKDKGFKINNSNLCVAPETLVLTDKGYIPIIKLANKKVNVWNGEEFSEVEVFKTGTNQKLISVRIELPTDLSASYVNYTIINCTPYHKFYIVKDEVEVQVQAQDLKVGDALILNNYNQDDNPIVASVTDEYRYDDTYCFTEPKRNKAVFNGILTGNCNEIMLMNDAEHSFSCVLSSMNVSKWHEWKNTDAVFWATIFLDCIAEEFIQKAKGIPALEKTVRFTEKSRALGLGQAGLATLFQQDGLAFEGFEAHMLSNTIAEHIHTESLKASQDMAKELGEPEWLVGCGLRNTHRIACAPTKTSSLIMGGISEGINPDPSMTFTQITSAGEIDRVNPTLLKVMKDKGVYTKKHIQEIVDAQGSVQGVSWLTEDEKLVFRTAFEMNMHSILRLASTRARYIDQWQSLNLFFSANEKPEVIARVHKEAFLDENILGLYYVYTQAGVQASKESECLACQ